LFEIDLDEIRRLGIEDHFQFVEFKNFRKQELICDFEKLLK